MTLETTLDVAKATPARARRTTGVAALCVLVLAFALVSVLGTPAYADAAYNQKISRSEVIARAHHWLFENVPYNQSAYHPDRQGHKYRTDCSGFISMAWHLDQSRTTATLDQVSTVISKRSLKPGDILLRRDSTVQHVVLFEKWTDSARTRANTIAQANSADDMEYYRDAAIGNWSTYTAYRYDKIFDDIAQAAKEVMPTLRTTARCSSLLQPDRPTTDLTDLRAAYLQALSCVLRVYVANTLYRHHALITITSEPGRQHRHAQEKLLRPPASDQRRSALLQTAELSGVDRRALSTW